MPDGSVIRAGSGAPSFRIEAVNRSGLAAMKSLDEVRIANAYINGDLNFEGDLFAALESAIRIDRLAFLSLVS